MRHHRALLVGLVIFLRLLFLNTAIQGDDIYYLAGAQHAQIDPLHPHHAKYIFTGQLVDMRGHPHPPLNAWILAGLLAFFKDVYEVRYHAAYILFSIVAVLSMYALARRFSLRPLLASLLFMATPVFLVNGTSLESDVPFVSLWLLSMALFIQAVDAGSRKRLLQAALAMVLTGLMAYQSVVAVPILALYLWQHRRAWKWGWLAVCVIPFTLAGYQLFERFSSGDLPAAVLAGYFQTYGLQRLAAKGRNAAGLTAHLGWVLFPALAVWAFQVRRAAWIAIAIGGLAAAVLDLHPLFWASFAVGLLVLAYCIGQVQQSSKDLRFLAAWVLVFYAAALILFYAGAARYLLPLAAPVAILASHGLRTLPRHWLALCLGAQFLLGISLAWVNHKHWQGYQRFANLLPKEEEQARIWVNGEWGLRYYAEARGGLPVAQGQRVQPGDWVVSSELGFPVRLTTGGGQLVPVVTQGIYSRVPLRLIALGSRSGYSTTSFGLRPFDVARSAIDIVKIERVVERKPTLTNFTMNHAEAEQHILSGLYALDSPEATWRWTAREAVVLLQAPQQTGQAYARFYVSDSAKARRVTLLLDGRPVAEGQYSKPGEYVLQADAAAALPNGQATLTVRADATFQAPGDGRELGIILSEVGFRD